MVHGPDGPRRAVRLPPRHPRRLRHPLHVPECLGPGALTAAAPRPANLVESGEGRARGDRPGT
ncbi:Conserved oligomeric Golgi complex component 8 [Streptomyces misionensis JCM 4497]